MSTHESNTNLVKDHLFNELERLQEENRSLRSEIRELRHSIELLHWRHTYAAPFLQTPKPDFAPPAGPIYSSTGQHLEPRP